MGSGKASAESHKRVGGYVLAAVAAAIGGAAVGAAALTGTTTSATSADPTPTAAPSQDRYQEGYSAGQAAGASSGYDSGYSAGRRDGNESARPGSVPTATSSATAASSASSDPQAAAQAALATSRAQTRAGLSLNGRWVLQLSSKTDGMVDPLQTAANGTHTFRYTDIQAQFDELSAQVRGAAMAPMVLTANDFGRTATPNGDKMWVLLADPGYVGSKEGAQAACQRLFPRLSGSALANACVPRTLTPPT